MSSMILMVYILGKKQDPKILGLGIVIPAAAFLALQFIPIKDICSTLYLWEPLRVLYKKNL